MRSLPLAGCRETASRRNHPQLPPAHPSPALSPSRHALVLQIYKNYTQSDSLTARYPGFCTDGLNTAGLSAAMQVCRERERWRCHSLARHQLRAARGLLVLACAGILRSHAPTLGGLPRCLQWHTFNRGLPEVTDSTPDSNSIDFADFIAWCALPCAPFAMGTWACMLG